MSKSASFCTASSRRCGLGSVTSCPSATTAPDHSKASAGRPAPSVRTNKIATISARVRIAGEV